MSYYQVLKQCISGQREINDEAIEAKAILSERLGELKIINGLFEGISFSQEVENLSAQQMNIAIA